MRHAHTHSKRGHINSSTHARWDWNAHYYYLCNDNDIIELLKSGPAKTRLVEPASTTMQDIGGGLHTRVTHSLQVQPSTQ